MTITDAELADSVARSEALMRARRMHQDHPGRAALEDYGRGLVPGTTELRRLYGRRLWVEGLIKGCMAGIREGRHEDPESSRRDIRAWWATRRQMQAAEREVLDWQAERRKRIECAMRMSDEDER